MSHRGALLAQARECLISSFWDLGIKPESQTPPPEWPNIKTSLLPFLAMIIGQMLRACHVQGMSEYLRY